MYDTNVNGTRNLSIVLPRCPICCPRRKAVASRPAALAASFSSSGSLGAFLKRKIDDDIEEAFPRNLEVI